MYIQLQHITCSKFLTILVSQIFIIISHAVSEKSQLLNEDDDGTDSDGAGPQATCKLSGVTTKSVMKNYRSVN